MACGEQGPVRERPRDWLVWHFTHRDNLAEICSSGSLLPSSQVQPRRSVANDRVKSRRTYQVKPDEDYPMSTVHDHVPFYIAAKSPMLFVVTSQGREAYRADSRDLVFMGVVLGDLADAALTWCVSDGNAAAAYTQFSRDLDNLGTFVDFDLLCQRMWNNTPDDPDRQSRRAAECLVLGAVPLDLVRVIVTRDATGLAEPKRLFNAVGGARQYHAMRDIFYN